MEPQLVTKEDSILGHQALKFVHLLDHNGANWVKELFPAPPTVDDAGTQTPSPPSPPLPQRSNTESVPSDTPPTKGSYAEAATNTPPSTKFLARRGAAALAPFATTRPPQSPHNTSPNIRTSAFTRRRTRKRKRNRRDSPPTNQRETGKGKGKIRERAGSPPRPPPDHYYYPHYPHSSPSSPWYSTRSQRNTNWGKSGDGSKKTTTSSTSPVPDGSSPKRAGKGRPTLPSSCTYRTPPSPPLCVWAESPSAPPPTTGRGRNN